MASLTQNVTLIILLKVRGKQELTQYCQTALVLEDKTHVLCYKRFEPRQEMSKTKKIYVSEYTEEILSVPKAHIKLELLQDSSGLKLTHNQQLLISTDLSIEGMKAGILMSLALGIDIPPENQTVKINITSGVLHKVISVVSVDFDTEGAAQVLQALLEEIDTMQAVARNPHQHNKKVAGDED